MSAKQTLSKLQITIITVIATLLSPVKSVAKWKIIVNKVARVSIGIAAIFVAAITVAIGSVIGLAMTAMSKDVFDDMSLAAAANTAMDNTVTTIYSSWPLSGLVVLAMLGAAALAAFYYFR